MIKLVLLILTITTINALECPRRAIRGFGFHTAPCYLYERFPTQFITAERLCRLSGGHLASIPDGFVNAFVAQAGNEAFQIMQVASFWIGGENLDDQNRWEWVDGEKWGSYTKWGANQPTNNTMDRCTAMKLIDGKWQAQNCFDRKAYVCELPYLSNKTTTPSPIKTSPITTTKQPDLVPACEEDWLYINQEEGGAELCYNVYSSTGWINDQHFCEQQNGTLISIHTNPIYLRTFIYNTKGTAKKIDLTIGLKEAIVNGVRQWTWVDGSLYDPKEENWLKGYPKPVKDGDKLRCGTYNTNVQSYDPRWGKWKDVNCDSVQARFVCSKEPVLVPESVAIRLRRKAKKLNPFKSVFLANKKI